MKFKAVLIFSLLVFVSACATYQLQPESLEEQATYYVNQAKAAVSEGGCFNAGSEIDIALSRPTGKEKVRELFASNQRIKNCYFSYLEETTVDLSSVYRANYSLRLLMVAKLGEVLSESQISKLFENLNKTVTEGNKAGTIPFVLNDKINNFPGLQSPEAQQIIIDRTINNLQANSNGKRPVAELMEYVQKVGVSSAEGKHIESLLSTLHIRRDELETVAKVFPAFIESRKEELTARVYLKIKNIDRLLREDLMEMFRTKVHGVEWVSSSGPKVITLEVEQVRNNEKTLPERTQTITYAKHEVNLVGAVLLMPRNASYHYELISGGVEIEYGYVIKAIQENEMIYDEVIRGKVNREYRLCQNARIQNVFGGVSAANFVANNDMQLRCNGPNSVSVENIRNEVLLKVTDGILNIPAIKRVHQLN